MHNIMGEGKAKGLGWQIQDFFIKISCSIDILVIILSSSEDYAI
jgi:hypothetical protein